MCVLKIKNIKLESILSCILKESRPYITKVECSTPPYCNLLLFVVVLCPLSSITLFWLPAPHCSGSHGRGTSLHRRIPTDEEEAVHNGVQNATNSEDKSGPTEGEGWPHTTGKGSHNVPGMVHIMICQHLMTMGYHYNIKVSASQLWKRPGCYMIYIHVFIE